MTRPSWRADRCWCIAHRGGAAEAPENTLAAFRHAVTLGADMVELDVRCSRDGIAVVCHDERVDRTTAASGPVGAFDVDALAALGIPTLADALAACAPLPVTVELKTDDAVDPAADVIAACGRPERMIAAMFDDDRLAAWRARCPSHPTSLSEGEIATMIEAAWRGSELPTLPDAAVAIQVPPHHEGMALVTAPVVDAAHALDLAVHVWTVDEPAAMRALIDLGVDGIMTDRPTRLRELLDRDADAQR